MQQPSVTFSGHESFPLRSTWLTKGVRHCDAEPTFFTHEDAMVELGVGKNMVRAIRHWCLATRLLQEDPAVKNNRGRQLEPTDLGRRLFLGTEPWDPYLEDTATLWVIHWLLATNPARATTWYFAFNHYPAPEFSRSSLAEAVQEAAVKWTGKPVNPRTIARDLDVFVRTYVSAHGRSASSWEDVLDCPLTELGLIRQVGAGFPFTLTRGWQDTLPDAVFAYALSEFAASRPGRSSFAFDELAYGPGSPGMVFKLNEPSLEERLERLDEITRGAWQFAETGGLRQLMLGRSVEATEFLASHYTLERESR